MHAFSVLSACLHTVHEPSCLQGLAGWPKLCLQVWTVDEHGKTDIAGYGFMNFPTAPGMYDLQCPTWVPEGTASASPPFVH